MAKHKTFKIFFTMTKSDMPKFNFQLNLSIDIDVSMRRIQEYLKLAAQLRNDSLLQSIHATLSRTCDDISECITSKLPDHDSEN